MALSNTPFPCFKSTGDDKHDIDIYTEDLKDYRVMQNWFDSSKETEAQRWTKPDKAIPRLRASLPPAARAIYKYSLGLSDEDQKKPHLVIDALGKFYGASIGVSGERQKFLRLLQEENEPIASWETRVRNQGAQCEYEDFADKLMRDQFIAGLTSLRVKLIGKGNRHRDAQTKIALREVVEVAKSFEATTYESEQDEETFANDAISASSTAKKPATKFFAHLQLVHKGKTKVVRAQIDSASTCNTIPEGSLHNLFPGIKISKSKASISTYGNQILHPKGQVSLCCVRRGKCYTLNFLVVDVPQEKPPLLSGSDAQALRFLNIFADETHMADDVVKNPPLHLVLGSITKQNVLQRYANIFEPGRGKPLRNPLHIEMDPSVTPVHAPRSLRDLKNINDDSMNFFMGFLKSSTLQTTFGYLGVVTP
ncbi:uncharacterized protein [Acropora muricata]|uniref:uncharacterized protein n=2 Tax=Acropora TaxID=6127 RepID=UPI0034E54852